MIPRIQLSATMIDHRLTSGIAVVSVLVLVVWAFRVFTRGDGVRGGALLVLASVLTECAIGAALVVLSLVGSNESLSRGLWIGAHLANTLILLAALSFAAWQATHTGERRFPRPAFVALNTRISMRGDPGRLCSTCSQWRNRSRSSDAGLFHVAGYRLVYDKAHTRELASNESPAFLCCLFLPVARRTCPASSI